MRTHLYLIKKSILWLGFNQIVAVRNINRLVADGYAAEEQIDGMTIYSITKEGNDKLSEYTKLALEKNKESKLRNNFEQNKTILQETDNATTQQSLIKGQIPYSKQKRERYEKSSMIAAMLYRYTRFSILLNSTLHNGRNNRKLNCDNSSVKETYRKNMVKYISSRKIRQDNENTKVGSSSRMNGIMAVRNKSYVLYNAGSKRLKTSYLEEIKMQTYINGRYGELRGNIIFGRSYKVLKDLLEKESNLMFVGDVNSSEADYYYTTMNEDGAKQMSAYIEDERKAIKEIVVEKGKDDNSQMMIYDGFDKEKSHVYIAIELNINELRMVISNMEIGFTDRLTIYCYKWQEKILRELLPYEGVTVRPIKREVILSIMKGEMDT